MAQDGSAPGIREGEHLDRAKRARRAARERGKRSPQRTPGAHPVTRQPVLTKTPNTTKAGDRTNGPQPPADGALRPSYSSDDPPDPPSIASACSRVSPTRAGSPVLSETASASSR